MSEYKTHIEVYEVYAYMHFSKFVPESEWGKKTLAEAYMKKYWLPEEEYLEVWKPIQDEIFLQEKSLPDLVYQSGFEMLALRGGCLFLEEDFLQLQKSLREIDEEYFVVIQHTQDFTEGEPMFRMKFPVSITWAELISGNYISAVLFEMSYNEYFVFGTKGNWGKYAANDYDLPLDIVGFMPELAPVFQKHFRQSKEEEKEIREWLPESYKDLIK